MTTEELAAAMFTRMEAATTGNNPTAAALWSQAWLAVVARVRVTVPLALPDTNISVAGADTGLSPWGMPAADK